MMSEWVEHDGGPCPVMGKLVEVKRKNGEVAQAVVRTPNHVSGPLVYQKNGRTRISGWRWAEYGPIHLGFGKHVVAYRIVDDGAEAETKRRTARMDTFRKMADAVTPNAPDPKLPAPKKRERVIFIPFHHGYAGVRQTHIFNVTLARPDFRNPF